MYIQDILDITINLNPASAQDFWYKLIPLLSPIIVILTFVFNNWYTRKTKIKENKRSWYFKAYLEPHLKKTEIFFNKADSIMRTSIKHYQNKKEDWEIEDRIEFIGKVQFRLANLKRKFEIEVVKDLKATYPKIFDQLENTLLSFEDSVSKAFEDDNTDPYFLFVEQINSIKNELIKALSGPALD